MKNDPLGSDTRETVQKPTALSATDGELNTRAIVYVGVGTAVVTIAAMVLVWWMFLGLRKMENAEDPKPSALPEAAERMVPPAPRLEVSPPQNMQDLRAREEAVLNAPAWIDQGAGTVRLPIDLALDVVARRGLGTAPPAVAAPGAPAAAPETDAATAIGEPASAESATAAPPTGGSH